MEEILASVQVRRDTKANWKTTNPVLLEGEAAYELDTDMFKIGDGVKHYSDLPYHNKVGQKGDTGNSGVYIGTSQPTDSNINVWIDSDGEPTEVIDDFAREEIGSLKDDLVELSGHRNLFNIATALNNKAHSNSLGIYDANGYLLTDFIPVDSGKTLYFSNNDSAIQANFVSTFDSSKNAIETKLYQDTFIVPSGISYVRITQHGNTTSLAKMQIEYDEITPFKNYVQVSDIAEIQTDIAEIQTTEYSRNLFNSAMFVADKEINGNGNVIDSTNNVGVTDYIKVISGKSVYFSNNGSALPAYNIFFIAEYDSSKTFIKRIATTDAGYVYSVPTDVYYIRVIVKNRIISTFQIEYDEITSYEPYYAKKIIKGDNIEDFKYATINMYGSVGAIGDSYTSGATQKSDGGWVYSTNQTWISTMANRAGIDFNNYGTAGATTQSYLTSTLPSVLSSNPNDLYFFALGQNDGNQSLVIGTVNDIHDEDYTLNADSFYGWYGKIIQQVKNHAPNANLIMIKNWVKGDKWTDYDVAIEVIAQHYGIPCISPFDDKFFNSTLYTNTKLGGHPTAMGYSMMGIAMERLFSKCVEENPSYFQYAVVG